MDFTKLNGIIQALEEEQTNPAPHHQNLTRLLIMAFKEFEELLTSPRHPASINTTCTVAGTEISIDPQSLPSESDLPPHKPRKSSVRTKKKGK